jgi:MFS transporter, FHS family, glucose/mannose:H+ symporter
MAFWIHAQFALIGITTVLLGPLLPTLAAHWDMRDLQSGYFFAAQYIGSVVGSILSTRALPRWGFARVCSAAMLILSSGLGVFVLSSWHVGLVGVFLNGLGMSLAIAASNLGVAAGNPARRASALSLLNFSWGIGAVASPFLVAAGLRYLRLNYFVPALGLLPLIFAVRFATLASSGEMPVSADSSADAASTPWRMAPFVLITTIAFFYVGTENALGGWIATYAKAFAPVSAGNAAMAPSAFWAALLAGRGLAPVILRYRNESTIFRLGLLTAMTGALLVLTTHLVPFLLTGAAIAGFGLAALFPIIVAVLSRELGERSSRLGGFFFAIGNFGGATIPFLVGAMSSYTHSLRTGLALTLATLGLILILSLTFSQSLAFSAREAR